MTTVSPHAYIAEEVTRPHHECMQRNERVFSRGNAAIAALALVAFIGVGALTLDSARKGSSSITFQNVQSQLAQVANATEIESQKNPAAQKCMPGYDYLIRLKDVTDEKTGITKKEPFVYVTTDGAHGIPPGPNGNQCVPAGGAAPVTTVPARTQNGKTIPARNCKPAESWNCYVTFCKPKGFTGDLLKQEDCVLLIEKPIPYGKEINKKQAATDSGFTGEVERAFESGDAATRQNAAPFVSTLPLADSSRITGAWDEQVQVADLKVAQTSDAYDKLMKEYTDCTKDGSPELCPTEQLNKAEAARNAAIVDRDTLASTQASIKPTDPSKCTNDVTCGAANPKLQGDKYDDRFKANTFDPAPKGGDGNDSLSKLFSPNALSSLMGLAKSALGLAGAGSGTAPTCTLTVSPKNITQAGQTVTLSWKTQGAQSAYLSNVGQVGPSGSMQVQPQHATTYSMQVQGVQQNSQSYNNQSGYQAQDNFCVTSVNPTVIAQGTAVPGCFNYRATGSSYSPYGTQSGTPTYGNCSAQVTLGADPDAPVAQISCQPKIAEVGTKIALSFACQNATASSGSGFSTGNILSGTTTATTTTPTIGSDSIVYGLTCSKEGRTHSAQCAVQVAKSAIVLVANPKKISSREKTNIGWITAGIDACKLWSPTLGEEWNPDDANDAGRSGTVKSPELTKDTVFQLECVTTTGLTKSASTTVVVE